MIRGWSQSDQPIHAIHLYNLMYEHGLLGNNLTYPFLFKACARVSDVSCGRAVHARILKLGFNYLVFVSNALIHIQCKRFREVLGVFEAMQVANVKGDAVTMVKVIFSCSSLGEWGITDVVVSYIKENNVEIDVYLGNTLIDMYGWRGLAVHDYVQKYDVKADVYVGNALIDMYCKCGVVEKALDVFKKMRKKDFVSWTSIITGLAVNGFANSALDFFSRMLREGVQPSHGAFVGILLACAHARLVNKGLEYFESMEKVYGLKPEMKHYGCIVDLLSRFGNLQRAYEFIKMMHVAPDVVVWRILLGASQVHGNISLAQIATKKVLELDPSNGGNYVLSFNTYASSNRWEDVVKMRGLMEKSNVQKPSDLIVIKQRIAFYANRAEMNTQLVLQADAIMISVEEVSSGARQLQKPQENKENHCIIT
ncbi:hypothetical protein RJT34_14523 [Clitoria ternatea]|uniref:Pentatricopeptide repeat-containing protein n=1 Tax=Clitoria ternatea TaxID=43366 RepID=A0AAN9JT21_CLITE